MQQDNTQREPTSNKTTVSQNTRLRLLAGLLSKVQAGLTDRSALVMRDQGKHRGGWRYKKLSSKSRKKRRKEERRARRRNRFS